MNRLRVSLFTIFKQCTIKIRVGDAARLSVWHKRRSIQFNFFIDILLFL